jgi:c-di-GMP-binding flagellar brake protein YcgR
MIISGLTILVAVLVAGGIIALIVQRRRALRNRHERQEQHLQEMLTELNLGAEERRMIEEVTGSVNPTDHIALMESRPTFERRVKAFRERNPEHPALRRLGVLRQRLGFGFANIRIPFSDTRMLPTGQRVQCRIPHPKKELTFITAVVASSESQFWVRPPSVKGKPVSLEKFPELGFRVSRENDAEYEFTCKVLGQSPTAMRPVSLAHTDQIRRLFFRNALRVAVDIASQFYVVRQEAAEKSHALLRARDSQYVVTGKLKDLSVGGALAFFTVDETSPHDGDTLIFHLPPAQIKDDLVAEVVRTVPAGGNELQVHLQFAGLKELDRLKLNKYLTNLAERPQDAPGGAGGPASQKP